MGFQIAGTLLDACVLSIIAKGDTYGYQLTQEIKEVVDISESTLYPVLKRLQKENYLTTYDKPIQGRNRRYYAITPAGRNRYELYTRDWNIYKNQVDKLIIGGGHNE